jgi:glycosyltransferase involved in cell wall biosynthesis
MVSHRDTPFVRLAVRSVWEQTMPDLELIFVDNGSGMTPETLGESGRDPRLRWIPMEKNYGIPIGMNTALNAAQGEFVAVLDFDDIALPERLEKQVAFLNANPGVGGVFSVANTINDEGKITGREFTLLSERDYHIFSAYDMPAMIPTLMMRREIMLQHPYRECFEVACDYDQLCRVAETHAICALPEVLLEYRRHQTQTTVQQRPTQVLNACIVRLITARRRAGRDEDLSTILGEFKSWIGSPPDIATQYSCFAKLSLAERFPLLAVYFARKTLSDSLTPSHIAGALRVLIAAWAQQPRQVIQLVRMFFTGPLRTHALIPA